MKQQSPEICLIQLLLQPDPLRAGADQVRGDNLPLLLAAPRADQPAAPPPPHGEALRLRVPPMHRPLRARLPRLGRVLPPGVQ